MFLAYTKLFFRFISLNHKKMSILTPKCDVKGMKILDKDVFNKILKLSSIKIESNHLNLLRKHIKNYLIKLEKFKPVQDVEDTDEKLVLFKPNIKEFNDLHEVDRKALIKYGYSKFQETEISVGYDQWRCDDILRAILPGEGLTSYSKIGHIVHVNLHEHLVDHKAIIGQIFLDKIPGAKTVVNKIDVIDNTYRNFQMEVLCGDNNLIAIVKENGITFELDFSSVYWNPRLCTEHARIIKFLNKGDVLYDVFAGIGPFSIPAAKKGVQVYANDLNPESFKWLEKNCKLNKVNINCFNKDGREFILNEIKMDLINKWKNNFSNKIHIVMNLPALATTFLDAFIGLLPNDLPQGCLPQIHVYCFVYDSNPEVSALKLVRDVLNYKIGAIEIKMVRKVSSSKDMMRVSFEMPYSVITSEEPANKKLKVADVPSF